MLKIYKLLYNSDKKKIFPINDSYNVSDHYKSTYKLHYKPIFYKQNYKNQYRKQLEFCIRLSYNYK
jgi:hypothetical protein